MTAYEPRHAYRCPVHADCYCGETYNPTYVGRHRKAES